jgi:hypothetical protein
MPDAETKATPGARFETEEVFGVGDRAVVRWVFRWDDQGGHVPGGAMCCGYATAGWPRSSPT